MGCRDTDTVGLFSDGSIQENDRRTCTIMYVKCMVLRVFDVRDTAKRLRKQNNGWLGN